MGSRFNRKSSGLFLKANQTKWPSRRPDHSHPDKCEQLGLTPFPNLSDPWLCRTMQEHPYFVT